MIVRPRASIGQLVAGLAIPLLLLTPFALAQPLPTNPELVTGELANGLKYIVKRHANPPGRATLWMHVHTGSLNETDTQRGLAHYLEHLAFNGSEHFPPGSVVPFFQSLGMTFGRDQNAFTSFDETTYQLSLPDNKPKTLSKGLTFFSDVLGRLLLMPSEIESERGIIQEERRRSLSGRQRTSYQVLEKMVPGSIFGQRIPIGTEESIDAVQRPDFQAYYGRWYVASNATLLAVIDADPADLVRGLEKEFADLPTRPRPVPQDVGVRAYEKNFAIVATDPEISSEEIRIARVERARPSTTTVNQFRDDLVALLATAAFDRRMETKVAAGGTSYLSASGSLGNEGGALHTAEISARAAPGKWKAALEEVALELQRARQFGFAMREIDNARREIVAFATREVATESTQPANSVLNRLNQGVTSGDTLTSAKYDLELIQQLLPAITVEEVSRRFASEFDPRAVAFIAILPTSDSVPDEDELLAIGVAALAVRPTPEQSAGGATELMAQLPTPGTIVESGEHEATQVWSGWLSNNVRVHHRFVDTEKNQATISIALLGGELLETAENRGITQASLAAWSRPATQKLSSTEISELLIGKDVRVRGGSMGGGPGGGRRGGGGADISDSITLTVSGSPTDLEAGMQLAHLLLNEPKVEGVTLTQLKTAMRQMLATAEQNPMMFGMRAASAVAFPADVARTQPITESQIDSMTESAAQAWLDRLITQSPIEVAVVGDLPLDRARELVARYVGSLRPRDRVTAELFRDLRSLPRMDGRAIESAIETATPQAFVMVGFHGPDETNVADLRAMTLGTRILSTRMVKEIREDRQLVYSISAGLRPGSTYPGFGIVSAAAPTQPGKEEELVRTITGMYALMASEPVSEDELAVAKKQVFNTLEEQMRDPSYWLSRLSRMTFRGVQLDDIASAHDGYAATDSTRIRATWGRYYQRDKSLTVVVKPVSAGSAKSD